MSQTPLRKALGTILVLCHICAIQAEPDNTFSKAEVTQLMKENFPKFIQKQSKMSQNVFNDIMDSITYIFNKYATRQPYNTFSEAEIARLIKEKIPNLIQKRSEMSEMPLERVLEEIKKIYTEYFIQEKSYIMLSEAEFDQTMKEQLPNFIQKRSEMPQNQFDGAMEILTDIINQHAIQEEPFNKLSEAEFAQLMKEGLPNFIQAGWKQKPIESLFKELDLNKDGEVSVDEFLTWLGGMKSSTMTSEAATGG